MTGAVSPLGSSVRSSSDGTAGAAARLGVDAGAVTASHCCLLGSTRLGGSGIAVYTALSTTQAPVHARA